MVSRSEDDKYGKDIYTAAFGYEITVGGDGMPISGIRVDCYTERHPSSFFQDDIWEEEAPIGKPYGFVSGYPMSGSTWDFDESHATVKTNSDGKAAFFIGLGDPNVSNTESGWLWPSGNNEVVTGVNLKFVVHKSTGDLVKECFCYFVRHEGDSFWVKPNIATGVFYSSASWLIPFSSASSLFMGEEVLPIKEVVEPEVIPRLLQPEKYPLIEGWYQYIWDSQQGWIWQESSVLVTLISPDMVVPNDAVSILSLSEPYVFFCEAMVEDIQDYNALTHTILLVSKTEGGEVFSWMPIEMQVFGIEGNIVRLRSEYIVPIDSSVGEGRYYDWWGNSGIFIHIPENCHLEVGRDNFYGDFDHDGQVNFRDFSMFAGMWRNGLVDEDYDLIFDATEDGRTEGNDLREFVGNWLGVRK